MEATSDYWKPFYYLLEDIPGVEVMLVNARHVKNMPGRFTEHHAFLAGIFLETIDQRTRQIGDLNQRIDQAMAPFRSFVDLICTIPGIGQQTAEVIVAETGTDMAVFPTARQLASWAGVCPGSNKSAGRVKSTKTRPGNAYLKAALGAAALSIAGSNGTFLAAKYKRLAARRGGKKALVAIEHTILNAIWSMATTGACGRRSAVSPNPDLAEQNADDAGPWRAAEH